MIGDVMAQSKFRLCLVEGRLMRFKDIPVPTNRSDVAVPCARCCSSVHDRAEVSRVGGA